MKKVFEQLSRNKLTKDEDIEHTIMRDWTLSRIDDFKDSLNELIQENKIEEKNLELSNYSFFANSDMSAQHGTCPEWSCRLRRVDELARFSSLYAESVYIHNYFEYLSHPPSDPLLEFDYRYHFTGDIKILNRYKPMFISGIFKLFQPPEPGFHVCSKCAEDLIPNFSSINKNIEKHLRQLNKTFCSQISANLCLKIYDTDKPVYEIALRGSEYLWPHGSIILHVYELPSNLTQKIKSVSKETLLKGVPLSQEEIFKSKIIQESITNIARDTWSQYFNYAIANMNLKYLTNRDIDVSFLEASTGKDYRTYNQILRSRLLYELPIFTNIHYDSLLKLREDEYDSFTVFRASINKVISEFITQKKPLLPVEADEIYQDMIYPQIVQLNKRVNSIIRSRWKTAVRDIIISSGLLTFGLCANIAAPGLETVLLSLGGLEAVKSMESIINALRMPEDIRNNNFFFLWKVAKKSKVI